MSGYRLVTSSHLFIFSKIFQLATDYKKLKQREYRRIEKELGVRYRGWEQMPGETFTDFKKRLTAKKVLTAFLLGAVFFAQLNIPQFFF